MLRASLINGEELAKSDVGERESRREKKAGDSMGLTIGIVPFFRP